MVTVGVGDGLLIQVRRHPLGGASQIFVEGGADGSLEALGGFLDQGLQGGVFLLGENGNVGQEAIAVAGEDAPLD